MKIEFDDVDTLHTLLDGEWRITAHRKVVLGDRLNPVEVRFDELFLIGREMVEFIFVEGVKLPI